MRCVYARTFDMYGVLSRDSAVNFGAVEYAARFGSTETEVGQPAAYGPSI